MNRALLWKELRMQRPVLLAGTAFALLSPWLVAGMLSTSNSEAAFDIVRVLPGALAGLWPFLAVAAGAITFATEAEDGTEHFLLSRPVSRARVWCVKVGAAVVSLAGTAVVSLAAIEVTATVIGPPPVDYVTYPFFSEETMFGAATVIGFGAMLFGCGVLCSTLVTRPLTAAAAAIALALALVACVFLLWSVLGLTPQLEPQWLGTELVVVALILLFASLLVFTWPEQSARRAGGTGTAGRVALGTGAVLTLCAGVLPLLFVAATPRLGEVSVVPGSTAYGERAVVMSMRDQNGTMQSWMLMTDGSGIRPRAGRHTLAPQWLSRRTLAYYSHRDAFGGAGEGLDLRLTDTNGSLSRLVFPDMPGVRQLFLDGSGFNGKIAFSSDDGLTVAQLMGYGHETIDVSGTPLADAMLLGFNYVRPGTELVVVSGDVDPARGELRESGSLFVYELADGSTRELRRLATGSILQGRMRNRTVDAEGARGGDAWRRVALLAAEPRENGTTGGRVERVDAITGDAQLVLEIDTLWSDDGTRAEFSRCSVVEPADQRRSRADEGRWYSEDQVLLADCSETARAEYPDGVVRLVGVRTGHQVTWPLPPNWGGELHRAFLEPRQEIVLLDIRGATPADAYAMTIDQSGGVRTYPAGWTPLGWTTLDYFLLQREDTADVTFAAGDARSGEVHGLYPENELREVLREKIERQRAEAARGGPANAGR